MAYSFLINVLLFDDVWDYAFVRSKPYPYSYTSYSFLINELLFDEVYITP